MHRSTPVYWSQNIYLCNNLNTNKSFTPQTTISNPVAFLQRQLSHNNTKIHQNNVNKSRH